MRIEPIDDLLRGVCHLEREKVILVGVSGGPDSLCLLDVLHRLGYPLVAAHFDHQLRAGSADEAGQVAQVAAERGIPVSAGQGDVAKFARERSLSIEEAARALRYRFLFSQAERFQAQAVAVGHTADDQVETVLMHFVRGAGLAGLKGMLPCTLAVEWGAPRLLVRPLLQVWRSETLAYCQQNNLHPIFDPSNQETTFFRNRLRLEAIPYLETFNPQFKQVALNTAAALTGDWETLDAVWQAAWNECLDEQGADYLAFDRARFVAFPPGIQRALIRKAAGILRPGLRDFDFDAVERALGYAGEPPASGQVDLAGGIWLIHEGQRFFLAGSSSDLPVAGHPQMASGEVMRLAVPGSVALGGNWKITATLLDRLPGLEWLSSAEQAQDAWLDADRLAPALTVRARQPGDRFAPLGLGGRSQKISDYMINVKLSRRLRAGWPLVCAAGEIVWVVGFRPAEHARVTANTRRIVHLHLETLV
ncbi:MAG TPA: tRNA lysidine(34) synthetase TilS [Anaerolineaceae bacterium]|nr:tRNA lysidine(34) synthetase TilS [Anaerolineaceae bacterium]